tara:strand:- start:2992 stop:3294 length:303 start_codon:yes stop_codon:yes gene_type:complete
MEIPLYFLFSLEVVVKIDGLGTVSNGARWALGGLMGGGEGARLWSGSLFFLPIFQNHLPFGQNRVLSSVMKNNQQNDSAIGTVLLLILIIVCSYLLGMGH